LAEPSAGSPSAPAALDTPAASADLGPADLRAVAEGVRREFPLVATRSALVLYDVDPSQVQAQWQVSDAALASAANAFPAGATQVRALLRLRRIAADGSSQELAALPQPAGAGTLSGVARLHVGEAGAELEAELGLASGEGGWLLLVRSNRIRLPDAPRPVTDAARSIPDPPPMGRAGVAPAMLVDAPDTPSTRQDTRVAPDDDNTAVMPGVPHPDPVPEAAGDKGRLRRISGVTDGAGGTRTALAASPAATPFAPTDAEPEAGVGDARGDDLRVEPALAASGPALAPEFPLCWADPARAGRYLRLIGQASASPAAVAATDARSPEVVAPRSSPVSMTGPGPWPELSPPLLPSGAQAELAQGGAPRDPRGSLSSVVLHGLAPPPDLEIHAELRLWGRAGPGSLVAVFGRPLRVGPDGRFSLRLALRDPELIAEALAKGEPAGASDR